VINYNIWDFSFQFDLRHFSRSQNFSADKNIISNPPTAVGIYFSSGRLTYSSHMDIRWFEPTPAVGTVF